LVFGVSALVPQQAEALPTLRFIIDGIAVDCADGAACDTSSTSGVVSAQFTQANFGTLPAGIVANVTTGITQPAFLDQPHMDLNTVHVQSNGVHNIVLLFSETDFSVASNPINLAFGGTTTIGNGTSVTAAAYFDNSGTGNNALFCGGAGDNCGVNGSLIATLGPFSGAFAGTASGPGPATTPYSLTQAIRLTTGTGTTTFSGNFELTSAVPEPASLLLLGGGLLGAAASARRRRRGKRQS
jgi:hypothetical protein